jgi:hypothetical protein
MRLCVAALALLLAGCGGGRPPPEPPDAELARLARTGQLAFAQGRPDQAAALFREALARARTRDDAVAIGDQATNLAIAELRRRDDTVARDVAAQARGELSRRGAAVPPELTLAEATARWRLGDPGAQALAQDAAAQPATAARASFLLGMIAADRGDAAGLAAARARVQDPADAAELDARAASGTDAREKFLAAATLRQDANDYAAMGRALAGAAAAQPSAADAADLWLRAGRAAAGARDRKNAELWFTRARQSPNAELRRAAEAGLAELRDSAG